MRAPHFSPELEMTLLLLAMLTGPVLPARAAGPPVLFYSDLVSGPNAGGQDGKGAFVTVWGTGFGANRGGSTVTVGTGTVAGYPIWSDTKITLQVGAAATSGALVVHTAAGASTPLPFTVRPGGIFFVSAGGNDGSDGSFAHPWASVAHAKSMLAPGDIAYLMNGVSQVVEDEYGAALSIEKNGLLGQPLALVAYPGAIATIGSTGLEFGVRVPNNEGSQGSHWVLSQLVLRGGVQAVDIGGSGSTDWRVVGNDISCPQGNGQTGCFAATLASHIAFLGNEVHGIGLQGSQPEKQYHAVYFTTDTSHVEVGWNHIHDNATCRALQFHSSPLCTPDCGASDTTGFNQFDLTVHDNLIHGDVCDGINLATVDPSRGPVRVYNNVIYDVGRGPSPPDGDANYAGIYVAGGTNTGADGTGVVEIYNNTLYDCGARALQPDAVGDEGMFARGPGSPSLVMELRDNLVVAKPGESYFSPSSDTSLVRGTNNLWFGVGPGPESLSANLNADPLLASVAGFDFHLTAASPAVDAGVVTPAARDLAGVARPQGGAYDIGAYELPASSPPPTHRVRRRLTPSVPAP